MTLELLQSFRSGNLTEKELIMACITEVAAGVYTYMRMLEFAERKFESNFFESIRTEVFEIRDEFHADRVSGLDNRMRVVYMQLETARNYLYAHKPCEAGLLQSVNNNACGMISTLKHYKPQ